MEQLEQYVAISGLRIQVIAQAVCCRTPYARYLHQRLARELGIVLATIRNDIIRPADAPELDESAPVIHLVDTLDVDAATNEYRVNRGPWRAIVSETPYLVPVSDDVTGGISRFVDELNGLGVLVTADELAFDEPLYQQAA
ncbi:hypothetical protein [Microvirga tunisiensis]|uniref:Uncharacterized protein n=1 Tax=Microvirga tunisiensis TaxID=2108360 RepID=A0A5N7N251_9HYPH|nr:hypothetical protein [Microvirga tunisiensis]MPR11948.1 hypothetical protein [Microvirga tunisiensis]MPR29906.1 hypothetical protein [Microvirga tunisiensis]